MLSGCLAGCVPASGLAAVAIGDAAAGVLSYGECVLAQPVMAIAANNDTILREFAMFPASAPFANPLCNTPISARRIRRVTGEIRLPVRWTNG